MTPERLREILERCEAATPGPWETGASSMTDPLKGGKVLAMRSRSECQHEWEPLDIGGIMSGTHCKKCGMGQSDSTPDPRLTAAEKLAAAARLAVLNFKRQNNSKDDWLGLGDDDHEAWSALNAALAEWDGVKP